MTTVYLAQDLERDEGLRQVPYRDSRGILTVGVGHNLQADPAMLAQLAGSLSSPVPLATCMALLASDIAKAGARLDTDLPWWRKLDDVRQDAMVNMAFNLGADELATWHHTLADIQGGAFKAAEIDLVKDEPWASQVGARAKRIAYQIETGLRAWATDQTEIDSVLAGNAPHSVAPVMASTPQQTPQTPPATIQPPPRPIPPAPVLSPLRIGVGIAGAGAVAGTAGATMIHGIDVSPVLNVLIQIAALVLTGLVGWAATRVARLAHVSAQSSLMQNVLGAVDRGINYGAAQATAMAAQDGTINVANETQRQALNYVITKMPSTLKAVGIDTTTPAGIQHVADLVLAKLPTP